MIYFSAGGDELPDRPRPTALSKPMQVRIIGLDIVTQIWNALKAAVSLNRKRSQGRVRSL